MKRVAAALTLLVLLTGVGALYNLSFASKERLRKEITVTYSLPASATRTAALDFTGLAADFQLLQAIFFVGEKIQRKEVIDEAGWKHFDRMITAVTDLDPYFHDAYYFAGAMYSWETGQFQKAIQVLKKGMEYRSWDRRLPFRIGFIYFYFLKDNQKGAEFIAKAAQMPGAPKYYATLASRLAYYAGDYKGSLLILKVLLEENRQNATIRNHYQKRITAIERAISIEEALRHFRDQNGTLPEHLEELVRAGFITSIPEDPYGGEFILIPGGRVYTTSRFVDVKSDS